MRIGHGYDVHRLVECRRLILGGVEIKFELGLLGHSDADVLTHAIIDSILGALGKGDIGKHFPDNDNAFKDINSLKLLEQVKEIMAQSNYSIENIDATIIAQKPKLFDYIDIMKKNISDTLDIDIDRINIKATTEEGLGFTGELLGISAHSVVLLRKI